MCLYLIRHALRLLVRAGAGVELVGPGLFVPLGHGRPHLRRVLTALALYDPAAAEPIAPAMLDREPSSGPRRLREIQVPLA